MSRATRLMDLLQELRRRRVPVSAAELAQASGVSLRTLYRDIETLRDQGADIRGEAGIGYVLRPGYLLPPLMFSEDELEALALGSLWLTDRLSGPLASASRSAVGKIAAVLPEERRASLTEAGLMIGPSSAVAPLDLPLVRQAIREERKVVIAYTDKADSATARTIWPLTLAFFDSVEIVVAWCELRQAFRHFRTDRIGSATLSGTRFPRRRRALLKEWRAAEGLPQQRHS